ncbi:MAG: hypothetical protein ACP5VP_11090 [Candidatus Limnocylindrales bacterium]
MGSTELSQLLRGGLGVVGGAGFLFGLLAILAGEPVGGSWLLIGGAILLLVALYEQTRYHAQSEPAPRSSAAPSSGLPWPSASAAGAPQGADRRRYERTEEVFDDPTTGRRLRVWYDPETGERRYVPEP